MTTTEGYLPFWDGTGDINDHAWDACWLGGLYLPGITTVECDIARSIEKKKQKGTDGTKVTDQGDELARIKIRTEVYNREQWEEWQDIRSELWPRKQGGERQPVEIVHPLPNFHGIKDIYLEKFTVNPPENQVMIIEIDAFEYQPNPVEVSSAAGRGSVTVKDKQAVQDTVASAPSAASSAARQLGQLIGGKGWLY